MPDKSDEFIENLAQKNLNLFDAIANNNIKKEGIE